MKTTIKVNGKRISKKEAIQRYGKERIEQRIKEAIEYFYEEMGCDDTSSWMDGMTITVGK